MTTVSSLHTITNRLLHAAKFDYATIFAACNDLYEMLIAASAIDDKNARRKHLLLSTGHAIDMISAAQCIKDIMRTKRFSDSIYEAMCAIRKTTTNRPVHILYAGTGPFATLILPLTALFSSDQVQFTLLEVNEPSFSCLQKLIIQLQLESYIRGAHQTDATLYTLPGNEEVDIFISETMQQALQAEPQVAIFMNIVPQLQPATIIIPQQVTVQAALINMSKRIQDKLNGNAASHSVHLLDTIFTLNRETISQHTAAYNKAGGAFCFPPTCVTIPGDIYRTNAGLYFLTSITLYPGEELLIDESALTLPLKLTDLIGELPGEIKFCYQMGGNPGIKFDLAS